MAIALLPWALSGLVADQVRRAAAGRGLTASWRALDVSYPASIRLRGLTLTRAQGDTALHANELDVALAFAWPPRPARLTLNDAAISIGGTAPAETDEPAWTPEAEPTSARSRPVDSRVRAAAQQLANAVLLPARRLPELRLARVRLQRGERGAWIEAFELTHPSTGLQMSGVGTLALADSVPFEVLANWKGDDTFGARASFTLADPVSGSTKPLTLMLDGALAQDRTAGELRLQEGATLRVGSLTFTLAGRIRRAGPRFEATWAGSDLTEADIRASTPRILLGPLDAMRVRGAFDWEGALTLDVAHPDSVRFDARTRSKALVLGDDNQLPLTALRGPFIAHIHVPSGTVSRELSPANPDFRPLASITPNLRDAVLTNEDGGFWWHRGFNTQAIQLAIAENLRAGRFKRGAGTITMQIARNLFLGQQKTLARKGQEVVLAWSLEHLARVPKERLLEIYLNIIEWGPGIHGAGEAARYYFDKDASRLTLDESLFLATLVPSPRRWRGRLTAEGELKPWVRDQMRFIAGKMSSKGWLDSTLVRPADSLAITLAGSAGSLYTARDTVAAAADSSAVTDSTHVASGHSF